MSDKNIQVQNIEDIVENSMMEFSSYVLLSRAIPRLEDGFKPVYRRILYTMHKMHATKLTKSANISGEVMKLHPHGSCLHEDTKLFLLDGSIKTIKELEQIGTPQQVLSSDDNQKIVPAEAFDFRKTKKVTKIQEITLSNGHKIKATEDHNFKLTNNTWINAENLKPGMIIDFAKITEKKNRPYIYGVNTPVTAIHRLVCEYNNNCLKGFDIHHIDKNPWNNNTNNLEKLLPSEHAKYHILDEKTLKSSIEKSHFEMFDKNGIKFITEYKSDKSKKEYVPFENETHKKNHKDATKKSNSIQSLSRAAIRNSYNFEYLKTLKSYDIASKEMPLIVEVKEIEIDEQWVYDFSVEKHFNALFCMDEIYDNKTHGNITLGTIHNCYPTAVGMVQKDRHTNPFIIGKGNFGQYTSRELMAAADRYSEMKLAPISVDMMKDFHKDIVPMIDNYDGTMKIPDVMPTKYPTILTFAQSGIGVGFSASLPSFNINEVLDATEKYLKTDKHTMLIPDFATGGNIIQDTDIFTTINNEGKGSIRLRGKAEIDGREINITEIPYSTTREAIIDKIVALAKTEKLKEVIDIQDYTGLKGMLITVTAKRNTDMEMLLEKLYKFTALEASYSSNMNILIDGLPRVLGTKEIISEWCKWRIEVIRKELKYDIGQLKKQLHIMYALQKVLLDIDKAIDIIRTSEVDKIEKNLSKHFDIDSIQAKEVADMKLRNINETYIQKQIDKIVDTEALLKNTIEVSEDNEKIKLIIIKDLKEIKAKYGEERRTQVICPNEIEITTEEIFDDVIEEYDCTIFTTDEGYVYKFKNDNKPFLKPGDKINKEFKTNNKGILGVIDDSQIMHKINVSSIKITDSETLGVYISNVFDNTVTNIISYLMIDEKLKHVITIYKEGKINKVPVDNYTQGTHILKNAYSNKLNAFDIIGIEKDIKLEITIDNKKHLIDTSELVVKKNRDGQGVFIKKGKVKNIKIK